MVINSIYKLLKEKNMENYVDVIEWLLSCFISVFCIAGFCGISNKKKFTSFDFLFGGMTIVGTVVFYIANIPLERYASPNASFAVLSSICIFAIIIYGIVFIMGAYKIGEYIVKAKKMLTTRDKVEYYMLKEYGIDNIDTCNLGYEDSSMFWYVKFHKAGEEICWRLFIEKTYQDKNTSYYTDINGKKFEANNLLWKVVNRGRTVVPSWKF